MRTIRAMTGRETFLPATVRGTMSDVRIELQCREVLG
jgi:hypothetical protein